MTWLARAWLANKISCPLVVASEDPFSADPVDSAWSSHASDKAR